MENGSKKTFIFTRKQKFSEQWVVGLQFAALSLIELLEFVEFVECVTDANPLGLRLEGRDRGFTFFSPCQKWTRRKGRAIPHF
jgi:hypothetical protein